MIARHLLAMAVTLGGAFPLRPCPPSLLTPDTRRHVGNPGHYVTCRDDFHIARAIAKRVRRGMRRHAVDRLPVVAEVTP